LCPSVVSLNKIKPRVESFIIVTQVSDLPLRNVVFGVTSYTSSSSSRAINKLRRIAATSAINSPWAVAADCIALAAGTVHSTRWNQMLAQNRDFCLAHLYAMPPLERLPSEYCHAVWYGKTKTRMVWLPMVKKIDDI